MHPDAPGIFISLQNSGTLRLHFSAVFLLRWCTRNVYVCVYACVLIQYKTEHLTGHGTGYLFQKTHFPLPLGEKKYFIFQPERKNKWWIDTTFLGWHSWNLLHLVKFYCVWVLCILYHLQQLWNFSCRPAVISFVPRKKSPARGHWSVCHVLSSSF